jgi:hypothetical protein
VIHYAKFRRELLDPAPARDVYVHRGPGRGWPEECPPIRAANGFGFDLPVQFDVAFEQRRGRWRAVPDITLSSDFEVAGSGPLTQGYAWFWEAGRRLPHPISPNVHARIRRQVKVSSYLYFWTDPGEVLLMTDVPNLERPWRCVTALIETDWYPAGYPWHAVIELDRRRRRVVLKKGEPLCRLIPLRRGAYEARAMSPRSFGAFFGRGQKWLARHGRFGHGAPGEADLTGTYVRQQRRSRFAVTSARASRRP